MNQDEEKRKTRKQSPPIGGIAQFATFGSSEGLEAQESRLPEGESGTMSEVEKSRSQNKEDARMSETQTLERSKGKQSERRQHTIYLSPSLSRKLRVRAAEEDREMSEIVEDALKMYLQKEVR